MTDGKHAVGLTGFPTPNTAAGIAGYLLFLFEDREYAQWILGALEGLTLAYNFYESGDLSPDDAAELFRVIVQSAPYNLKTCANPSGGKILHVATNGHVEQLSDANTWETPDGEYTIPPVPEREGGTEDDQICLASKNAANVLQLLYENVADSFNNDLDEAEAATALTLTLISLIGSEFAPITFGLVTFFGIVFSVLYGLLEFIVADLWDEDFTASLVCILRGCASNDGGVVTFDYDCFNDALAAQTTVFDLTFAQLRLFGQIQYLLMVIGGVDALNAAGATTAITDDVCDCGCDEFNVTYDENRGTGVDNPTTIVPGGTYTFEATEFPGFPGFYSLAMCFSCCLEVTSASGSGDFPNTNHVLCGATDFYHGELVGHCFQRINYGNAGSGYFEITLTFGDEGCGTPSAFGCS